MGVGDYIIPYDNDDERDRINATINDYKSIHLELISAVDKINIILEDEIFQE